MADGNPDVLLKGQSKDLLTHRHLPCILAEGQKFRSHQTYRVTELPNFRARTGGAAATIPVLKPPPMQSNLNLH